MTMPGLPPQASAQAVSIDYVLALEHWAILALFVFFFGYFVYVLLRFRSGANPKASYTGMKSAWSIYVVFAIAIAEGVLLVAFEMPEWRDRVSNIPGPGEATVVRVVAEEYQWNVHYPGPDGKFGRTDLSLISAGNPLGLDRRDPDAKDDITAINQLTVPVNHPVLIRLTSKDVIHSFTVYEMRVKQDAIPGTDSPVWFVPTVTTEAMRARVGRADFEYEIGCSQLCGLGHYRMRGFLNVTTDAQYQAFLADEERALNR
jgi:cytochrome c oxidase subunit 2